MELPTLYKLSSSGKVQQWTIVIEGDSYYTKSGQTDGKLTQSKPTVCKGKNLTKTNATTPESQAEADARAKWKKKQDEGYGLSVEASVAARSSRIEPMLAHPLEDVIGTKHDLTYPLISQPKLDGVRCLVTRDEIMSRKWLPIVACPHVFEATRQLFLDHPELVCLDGELYNHMFHDEFHEIISLVRKTKPTEEDLAKSKELIQYHIYDVILNTPYSNAYRNFWRERNIDDPNGILGVVPSTTIDNKEQLDTEYERLMELGYEGQILRRAGAPYEHKRSYGLIKRKSFVDEEFEIVGWEDCVGNRAGTFSFHCKWGDDGDYFVAPLNGTVPYLKSLYPDRNKFIGQFCTVKYFPPPAGAKPRFARCKAIRPMQDGEPAL